MVLGFTVGALSFWCGAHFADADAVVAWRAASPGAAPAVLADAARLAGGTSALLAWLAVLAGAVAGVVAWRAMAAPPQMLAWDGQRWRLDTVPQEVAVAIDLGAWMLLRLQAPGAAWLGRSRWLAVGAADAGPSMHALRVALFAAVALGDPAAAPSPPSR